MHFTGRLSAAGVVGAIALGITLQGSPALSNPTLIPARQMAQASLTGSWRLVTMGEIASPGVVPQDVEQTAEFEGDRLYGSGGCNRFRGGFQTTGDQLSITPLASTRRACEPTLMTAESRYLAALQGAQRYEFDGPNQLSIYYQTEQESGVLRFSSTAIPGLW